jgi:hypothetical protein
LKEYKAAPLAETYKGWEQVTYQSPGKTWSESQPVYWIRLSGFGEQYYCENWQRYRELYPEVDAPAPAQEHRNTEETRGKRSSEQQESS